MAYNPTSDISAYVDANFTNLLGWSAVTRTDLKLLAGLTNATYATTFYTISMANPSPTEIVGLLTEKLNATQYCNLPEALYVTVFKLAEYSAKLAWQNGGSSSVTSIHGYLNQSGTSVPTLTNPSDYAGVITFTYDAPGEYTLLLPDGSVPDPTKVFVSITNNQQNGLAVYGSSVAGSPTADAIVLYSSLLEVDTGVLVCAPANGLFTDTAISIYIFP